MDRKTIEQFIAETRFTSFDQRFNHSVKVIHEDGSVFCINHAFFVVKKPYLVCFTEHNGCHFWHKDDLLWYEERKSCTSVGLEDEDN